MSDRRFPVALLISVTSCAASEELTTTESEVTVDVASGEATAGGGWFNGPIPQLDFGIVAALFSVSRQSVPIDAVFGFSNGPADAFGDLGPIVRLNDQGFIDARDGDSYRAEAAFDYRDKDLGIAFSIHLDTHRYSVNVNNTMIAENYAFRTEQSSLSRLDTLAAKVDSAQGSVTITNVDVTPSNCAFAGQSWVTQAYPAQSGSFYVQIDARVPQLTDAVVGLAASAPLGFADLAAIVRFRPDGMLDVRDGSGYRADAAIAYSPHTAYRFTMIVDLPARRYSVHVGDPYGSGLGPRLADSYAFRTEQAGATQLSRLGSFTDGPGYVHTCYLNVWNHW